MGEMWLLALATLSLGNKVLNGFFWGDGLDKTSPFAGGVIFYYCRAIAAKLQTVYDPKQEHLVSFW